ncbi:MAG: TIGR04086 family membrane protein [Lachnospiraceae bacterium]|nr:TIGR04086 family membrane protein [Lachnospiraceae bacterium]
MGISPCDGRRKEKGILRIGKAYYFVRTYEMKRINMLSAKLGENSARWLLLAKVLLAQYVVTGLVIIILSFILLKWQASENILQLAIIAIYVLVNFLGGLIIGKTLQKQKFLWGLIVGVVYFVLLSLISFIINKSFYQDIPYAMTVLGICAGSGMLGGMVS